MSSSRRFLVCIHDATPAYARETRVMIRDLAPLIGRRLSFGVVPNWYGEWPLAADPGYCRLVRESSEELLLHGYFHHRRRGGGPATLLTKSSDEMNGLNPDETHYVLDCGQRVFIEAFGEPARGFIAPAWQAAMCVFQLGRDVGRIARMRWDWTTFWVFSLSSRRRAGEFPWRHRRGTVADGAGSGTSAMELAPCCNRSIVFRSWRFTRGISSAASGRRSCDARGS